MTTYILGCTRDSRTTGGETSIALRRARKRAPESNRERLYGLLPIPSDNDYETASQKRDAATRVRLLHSTIDETKS